MAGTVIQEKASGQYKDTLKDAKEHMPAATTRE
jgi:hypothetical protein